MIITWELLVSHSENIFVSTQELLSMIGPLIKEKKKRMRQPIPAEERLAIGLSFMAIGDLWLTHCVKSVQIRSFSGPYFPAFGLNTERYAISLYSVRMWKNTNQKKLRIWTLFTQWLIYQFRVHETATAKIILEVCGAIYQVLWQLI